MVKSYFLDHYFVVVMLAEKLKKWEVGARFFVERWGVHSLDAPSSVYCLFLACSVVARGRPQIMRTNVYDGLPNFPSSFSNSTERVETID